MIMSAVEPSKTNEAGGLQGTAQNLGASLGTALIGAVLSRGSRAASVALQQNPAVTPGVQAAITQSASGSR